MNLKTRRYLYSITIILFVLLVPLTIAYAVGWRFDPQIGKFIQTGGLYIRTMPSGAEVNMEDGKTYKKSPVRIRYVWPGEKQVTVEKPGYATVNFNISIKENEVVLIDPLELIPQDAASVNSLDGVSQAFFSPYDPIILLTQQKEDATHLILLDDGSKTNGTTLQSPILSVEWRKDFASIKTQEGFYILNLEDRTMEGPFADFDSLFLSLDGQSFYATKNDQLFFVDLDTGETIISQLGLRWAYQHGNVTIEATKSSHENLRVTKDGKTSVIGSVSNIENAIPLTDDVVILQAPNGDYILNVTTRALLPLNAKISTWALYNGKLYFANDFEIWEITIKDQQKRIVNRFSERIQSIAVSPLGSGLFISFGQSSIFWYVSTPTPVSISLSKNEPMAAVQRLANNEYRTIAISNGLVLIKDYRL